jgi:glycosylphosphatidylinositol transamidase
MSPEQAPIYNDASPSTPQKQPLIERLLKRPTLLLITPYIIGLLWTALHPLVSIVTGELKCRGIYIDENGLDVHRHRVESYPVGRWKADDRILLAGADSPDVGMCDALKSWGVARASTECLRHRPTGQIELDVVKISPSIGPVVQSPEAIVLVVNDVVHGDWYGESDLNASILHLIQRLGSKKDCPWLAKTVFVVSPITTDSGDTAPSGESSLKLDELVEAFLSSYSGKQYAHDTAAPITPLPPHFAYPLIRSVLVLSNIPTTNATDQQSEVRILPHGKKGALPNLDLVFATVLSFQSRDKSGYQARSIFHGESNFRVHPFPEIESVFIKSVERFWNGISGDKIQTALGIKNNKMNNAVMQYAKDMGGLLGFMGASMLDKAAPHYPALERGIDSLTIELRIPSKPMQEVATSTKLIHTHHADTARVTEHLLRSISNLHERLHHSVAQYTLPSMIKFVSHGEYIFPAILVSLPMAGRAAMLALRDIQRFRFRFVGVVTCMITLATIFINVWSSYHKFEEQTDTDWSGLCVYLLVHLAIVITARHTLRKETSKWFKHSPEDDRNYVLDEHHKSLRFIACLFGVYLHAPLLLANYSLGFPSAVFWSPLLAIFMFLPSTEAKQHVGMRAIVYVAKVIVLVSFCPQFFLVPLFGSYTEYVTTIDTPLHLIMSALWL